MLASPLLFPLPPCLAYDGMGVPPFENMIPPQDS